MGLKKELSFVDIFSIAVGAMISSGIFILPGLAFVRSGPAVFVSYFLAGVLALIGVLSVIELSTAMPKAGGDYYFVTRSLGPFIGTISGVFGWVAISLKSAFALFGMAEIVFIITGFPLAVCSIVLCLFFVSLNVYGVRETVKLEVALVIGLLGLMTGYVILGSPHIEIPHFDPLAPKGINAVFSTTGFVFVSFGGLISVASVSEEVKQPKKNIPLGLIAAVLSITVFYTLMLIVTVGVLPADQLSSSLTPIADTARTFLGTPGYVAITFAALLAFITTAISGIMSASRYPLALSRDRLIPALFSRLTKRSHTPFIALSLTGGFIILALLLPLDTLVKAASTVILSANLLANLSVIILRESKVQNYQPSFRAPLYPWLQIVSIILFGFFIIDMGLATMEISAGFLICAMLLYLFYGKTQTAREYALLHLVARITNKKISSRNLETELRDILHQRDEIRHDRLDELLKVCPVIDLDCSMNRPQFFSLVAEKLADKLHLETKQIGRFLEEREKESSTALTPFLAIPHLVVNGEGIFDILVARSMKGIHFSEKSPAIKAVFVIIGTRDERNFHLKTLAAIAQILQEKDFEQKWLKAANEHQLRDLLLLSSRKRT